MTVTLDELNDSHHEKTYTLSKLREAVNNGASPEDIFKACHEYDTAFNVFGTRNHQKNL